jgi:hypothetical protein
MPAEPMSSAAPEAAAQDTPASRFPIAEFRRFMETRQIDRALDLCTEDVLARPFGTDEITFQGREEVRAIWSAMLEAGTFTYREEFHGHDTIVALCDIRFADDIDLEALDVIRINADGKIHEIQAMARPYQPLSLFAGRVALAFARQGGGLPNRMLANLLVWPLELLHRVGDPVGVWLVRGAIERRLEREREGRGEVGTPAEGMGVAHSEEPQRAAGETPVDRFPVARFRRAMEALDHEGAIENWSDDVVARSLVKPSAGFRGKEENRLFLWGLLKSFDSFEYTDEIRSYDTILLFLRARFAGLTLYGIDFLKMSEEGKVSEFSVRARPYMPVGYLPAMVALPISKGGGRLRNLTINVLFPPQRWIHRRGYRVHNHVLRRSLEQVLARGGAA